MKLVGEFLILAERYLHDSQTDALSLIHCIEAVAAPTFPARHPNFAVFARYRLDDDPPNVPVPVDFRLMRVSAIDGEELIAEFPGSWAAGTTRARIATNFQYLRLKQPERLLFRIDHRVSGGEWLAGPSCAVDVVAVQPPSAGDQV